MKDEFPEFLPVATNKPANSGAINRLTNSVVVAFWCFNAAYLLAFSLIGGPLLLQELLDAVIAGAAPAHHIAVVLLAMLLPVVCLVVAAAIRLSDDPVRLGEFLVGVELPLAVLLIGRSVWAHELTATSIAFYFSLAAIALCQGYLLVRRHIDGMPVYQSTSVATAGISALVAIGGVYFSITALAIMSPVIFGLLYWGGATVLFSLQALILMPPAVLALPVGALMIGVGLWGIWLAAYAPYSFVSQWVWRMRLAGNGAPLAVSLVIFCAFVATFAALHQRAKPTAITLLSTTASSAAEQRNLLQSQESIRTDLLDSYLSPVRFLPDHLGMRSRSATMRWRASALKFLLPTLVYQGDSHRHHRQAQQSYETFFDAPIQRAEREPILEAIKQRWSPGRDAFASLLEIGQQTVHADRQDISITTNNGVATVTVQETLYNHTSRSLETLMYFSLPDEAAITGLWLSDTATQPLKFPFAVAPRGVAQQVYREQVRRSVDPALLERIAPGRYRLRVFPLLPKAPMYVRMTYKTIAGTDGRWLLPRSLEQRNVYYSEKTIRTVNGRRLTVADPAVWIPPQVADAEAPAELPASPATQLRFNFNGEHYRAFNLTNAAPPLSSIRMAVLIDGSYSMGAHQSALRKTINALPAADIFFCQSACSTMSVSATEPNAALIDDQVFFGNSQPLEQLQAFSKPGLSDRYDAVLLLSDGGSYELATDQHATHPQVPMWLIETGHQSHALPDALIDTLKNSGGGIASSVSQALITQGLMPPMNEAMTAYSGEVAFVTDRHVWLKRPVKPTDTHNQDLAPIAMALAIQAATRQPQTTDSLDQWHALAIEHGIVTDYSSMLVLVNNQQRERLKELSEGEDRFEREVESGNGLVPVQAVPEPHEWALLLIGLLLLLHTARERGWSPHMLLLLVRQSGKRIHATA